MKRWYGTMRLTSGNRIVSGLLKLSVIGGNSLPGDNGYLCINGSNVELHQLSGKTTMIPLDSIESFEYAHAIISWWLYIYLKPQIGNPKAADTLTFGSYNPIPNESLKNALLRAGVTQKPSPAS